MADTGEAGPPPDLDLEKLIAQRKLKVREAARSKQLKDFKTIARLNWTNHVGLHPLQILPKEMWIEIFNHLDDPRDLQSTGHCCHFFSVILEPRRISEILFPQVLKVARFRQLLTPEESRRDLYRGENPFIRLRRVCRSLRSQVDRCNESVLHNFIECNRAFDSFEAPMTFVIPFFMGMDVEVNRKLRRIMEYFKPSSSGSSSSQPSLLRKAWDVIVYPNRDDFPSFSALLTEALHLVGTQILSVRLELNYGYTGQCMTPSLYETLRAWLSHMPNLKFLNLFFFGGNFAMPPDPFEIENCECQQLTTSKPFPSLPNLVKLDFDLSAFPGIWERRAVKAVLRSNLHVKSLAAQWTLDNMDEELMALLRSLPLESFTYRCGTTTPHHDLERLVQDQQPPCQWQLRQVRLAFGFHEPRISMSGLLRALERFPELESVHLRLDEAVITDSGERLRPLALPKLRLFSFQFLNFGDADSSSTLEIWDLPESTLCMDYLIRCGELEELRWSNQVARKMLVQSGGGIFPVQFSRGGKPGLVEKSMLWSIFPRLRRLCLMNHPNVNLLNVYSLGEKVGVVERPRLEW